MYLRMFGDDRLEHVASVIFTVSEVTAPNFT
jgi:hypothetical protein